eukprot:gene23072-28056_t
MFQKPKNLKKLHVLELRKIHSLLLRLLLLLLLLLVLLELDLELVKEMLLDKPLRELLVNRKQKEKFEGLYYYLSRLWKP